MDFVSTPPPQFSVGFVSLASGVLLAASLFRKLLSGETIPHASGMTTFNFLNGNLGEGCAGTRPSVPDLFLGCRNVPDSISEL